MTHVETFQTRIKGPEPEADLQTESPEKKQVYKLLNKWWLINLLLLFSSSSIRINLELDKDQSRFLNNPRTKKIGNLKGFTSTWPFFS